MKINEGKKYKCKNSFVFQEEEIRQGDMIGINHIESPVLVDCELYHEDGRGMK